MGLEAWGERRNPVPARRTTEISAPRNFVHDRKTTGENRRSLVTASNQATPKIKLATGGRNRPVPGRRLLSKLGRSAFQIGTPEKSTTPPKRNMIAWRRWFSPGAPEIPPTILGQQRPCQGSIKSGAENLDGPIGTIAGRNSGNGWMCPAAVGLPNAAAHDPARAVRGTAATV